MAPVSNTVVGIDDDQRFALMKFRRSVKDVLKPEHDDHFLLRWLRARQWDPDAAEKMLRDSMEWREKWEIDTKLSTWQASEVLEKYFPSGSTGFDKEGSPVIIVPFAGLDVWGVLHSVSKSDTLRMVLRHLEGYLASAKEQAVTHGPAALKVVVLFDMEGWSMRQYAWRPAAEMVFSLLQIYEANYPEILKTCFIVNAPKVFALAFNVIKKFMHEYTISKIAIFGTDTKKWKPQVLALVDAGQLPQHYGGTLVDADGDPKCSSVVKPGGKVPKSFYTKNLKNTTKEYKKITVKTGDIYTMDLLCAENESVLKWEFGVDSHDIVFKILKRDEEGAESVVHGPRKVTSDEKVDVGVLPVDGPATYTIMFDNKSAYHRNKKIFYDVVIANPAKDMDLQSAPEEGDGATSCSTNL